MRTAIFDESRVLFSAVSALFLAAVVMAVVYRRLQTALSLLVSYVLVAAMLVWFYRYPTIQIPVASSNILYAPCDGLVKAVEYDPANSKVKIIVFLNIFDQHHQFYPLSGHVIKTDHFPGAFHPAYLLEKSKYNEKQETTIRGLSGETITITQIAGQIARRIVNNAREGAAVKVGERMGMIKLSSRVDIEFDKANFITRVTPGTRLVAMQTPIAYRRMGW